mmetsp:Transcript_45160/g.109959  ORF Transcript_45160/g.109959 Transcript_45160/m.109959 type:complete len:271 (+) Transcript_45160:1811-2623(+)
MMSQSILSMKMESLSHQVQKVKFVVLVRTSCGAITTTQKQQMKSSQSHQMVYLECMCICFQCVSLKFRLEKLIKECSRNNGTKSFFSFFLHVSCHIYLSRFHTGDVGRVNANGWLSVTGRIKEQYKLENGKFVVPTPIEDAIGMSRFIDRVVVTGANRPHNVVLIVPEWAAIREELDVDEEVSEEEIVNDVRLKTLIDEELRQSCAKLKKFEIPKAWMFVAPFTVANNMLTQKQSTRRHKVIEAYKDAIGHLYDGEASDAGVGMQVPKAA